MVEIVFALTVYSYYKSPWQTYSHYDLEEDFEGDKN